MKTVDLLLAVPEAMTANEIYAFLHRWNHINPHQVGIRIPDALDLLDSTDAHLPVVEPLLVEPLLDEHVRDVPPNLSARALVLAAYVVLYSYGLRAPAPCDSCGGAGVHPAIPVLNRPGGPCDACDATGTDVDAPAAPWLLVEDFLARLSRYVSDHP